MEEDRNRPERMRTNKKGQSYCLKVLLGAGSNSSHNVGVTTIDVVVDDVF